jgi:hypothetical protein
MISGGSTHSLAIASSLDFASAPLEEGSKFIPHIVTVMDFDGCTRCEGHHASCFFVA